MTKEPNQFDSTNPANLSSFQTTRLNLATEPKTFDSYRGQEVEISSVLQRGKPKPIWVAKTKASYLSATLADELNRVFDSLLSLVNAPEDLKKLPYVPYRGKIQYNQAASKHPEKELQYTLILNPACLLHPVKATEFFVSFFDSHPDKFAFKIYVAKQTQPEILA
jgi:hypothetical protein